jgi:TolA-binding protein
LSIYEKDILYNLIKVNENLGRMDNAITYSQKFIEKYPNDTNSAKVQYWMGYLYEKNGAKETAWADEWSKTQTFKPS